MNNKSFELYPVMLTPFHENNEIDFEGLRQLTEFYIATGSTGLFANCLTGEMFQLTDKERIDLTAAVVDQVGGRQDVVASGTFGYDQDRNIRFIKEIYDTGIQAVVLNTNQMVAPSEDESVLKRNLDKIIKGTENIPLGVYECPVPDKRLLSPDLLHWMGASGRFVFLKDTSCDLNQIRQKLKAVEGSSLRIFNANISTGLGSIESGAHGLGSTASNFYPEFLQYLSIHARNGGKEVEKINTFITLLDQLIHECYPMSAKYFMKLRGMKINLQGRIPSGSFSYQDIVKFDELYKGFVTLADELEIDVYHF
ncbi:MAG: dihydrodipicolinate synthase family protein [Cyclobacteriaceae bacterium]